MCASDDSLIINEGIKPVLVVSIHSCHAHSAKNPKKLVEARVTKELNEILHHELGYYSFIYTGYRTRCIKDTKEALVETVENMLSKKGGPYDKIGVISLHCRGKKRTKKNYPDSIFELGTLRGRTLDFGIAADLWTILGKKEIVFDYNFQRNTSAEVAILHRKFNDINYVKGKYTPGHDPRNNTLQMAQLEFDDWKKREWWIKDGVDRRFSVCNALGDLLIAYVRQRDD
jgi:hypothetical protein